MLKVARHFRLDEKTKFVVGRNKDENEMIKALALPEDLIFYARDHMGPIALLRGQNTGVHKQLCAAITLRYSDAPKESQGTIIVEQDGGAQKSEITTHRADESDYTKYRI
jgi:predicted ribosome quality control (RQC) complex YloA/Tae2 family protein